MQWVRSAERFRNHLTICGDVNFMTGHNKKCNDRIIVNSFLLNYLFFDSILPHITTYNINYMCCYAHGHNEWICVHMQVHVSLQSLQAVNWSYHSTWVCIQVQDANDGERSLSCVIKFPGFVNDTFNTVSNMTIRSFKGWWKVWRKNKAERENSSSSWKFYCIPSLGWPCNDKWIVWNNVRWSTIVFLSLYS